MTFVEVSPRKALGRGAEAAQDEAEGSGDSVELVFAVAEGRAGSIKPALPDLRAESLTSSLCLDVVSSAPGSSKHSGQKADRASP